MGYTVKVKNDLTQEESEVPVQLINNSSSNVDTGVTKGLNSLQQEATAPVYSNSQTYAIGDICTYGGQRKKCIVAITSPKAFDENDWQNESIETKIATKQETLVSGTNIKTLNNESLLGSGNISINGAVWGNITGTLSDQIDLNTALSGKQNTISSDNKLGADLVDDTSATNKFVSASEKTQITTNQTNIENHTADKTNPHETKVSNLDDVEISSIQDNQILQYDSTSSKWKNETFSGAEIIYGDLPETAENGKYYATPNDSNSITQMLFNIMHPINSFYQQLSANDNPNTMFNVEGAVSSTWEDVSATYNNKAIWISSTNNAGTQLSGSLPNITGKLNGYYGPYFQNGVEEGALKKVDFTSYGLANGGGNSYGIGFDASNSNSIYSASAGANIVRPTSITCKLWKRIQ